MINIQGDPLRMRPLKSGKVWIGSLLNSSRSGHIRAQFSTVRSYPHTVQYSPAISAHSTVRSGHIRTHYSTVRPYPLSVQYGPALFADSDSMVANVNFANHSFENKNKASFLLLKCIYLRLQKSIGELVR